MASDLDHVFDPCQLLEHKSEVLGHRSVREDHPYGTGFSDRRRGRPARHRIRAVGPAPPRTRLRRRGRRTQPGPPRPARRRARHNTRERGHRLDRAGRPRQAGRRGADLHAGPDARRPGRGVRRARLPHPAGKADGAGRGGVPADRGRRGEGRRHARRRPRDALHAVHARGQADRRLRPARRHHERPAPGAGRLLAPGPFLRPRQLAAQRPGHLHADGQVLPRPGLAAVHPGPGAAAGLELRQPDPFHRREPAARRRGPVRGLLGRTGLPLFGAAALPRPARPGRARLAAERRHRRLLSRSPGRGPGHRAVRPVRLRLRQRRRRPPGRRAGVSRRDHGPSPRAPSR